MPTAYTYKIEDGIITTGRDFLIECMKAFGVECDIGSDPLTAPVHKEVYPNTYYQEEMQAALKECGRLMHLSLQDARDEMIKRHKERTDRLKRFAEEIIERNKRYAKVRAEIKSWKTAASMSDSLKRFALNQIDICMDDQFFIDELLREADEPLDDSDKAVKDYIAKECKTVMREYDDMKAEWNNQVEMAKKKNEWARDVIASLYTA